MTEILEHDRKMTTMNINLLNMTKKYNKNCHNDEHEWLNMTENNTKSVQKRLYHDKI